MRYVSGIKNIVPLFLLTTACGQLPGFQVGEKSDNFTQTASRNDKIDILFIVDNSGSMDEEQANLASSFASFIEKFQNKNLNFQIGVISTDVSENASYWAATGQWANTSPYINFPNAGPGTLLARTGNEKILKPTTTNLVQKFMQNVSLGTLGSGNEAGILSATKFLNFAGAGGWNEGFIRDEAMLSMIFLSDEDESKTGTNNGGHYIRQYSDLKTTRVNDFLNQFKTKKVKSELLRADAIVAPSVGQCPTVGSTNGVPGTGDVYIEIADLLGGETANICQDFSSDLENLGASLIQVLTRFKLAQVPTGQIEITVDGVLMARDAVNGWEYLPATNEVEFRGNSVPNANAQIQVSYVPGAPLF